MSMFNTTLTEVDEQKKNPRPRGTTRCRTAERQAQLQGMDQKPLGEEKGVVSADQDGGAGSLKHTRQPQTRVDTTRGLNANKVDIGGGKFNGQGGDWTESPPREVQPLLDEINEKSWRPSERGRRC